MRIKSIRVRNFKSFKDCTINFNDFNVVIGSNASGKSNLVQIFKFLKDIEEYGLENAISLQGGVEYFINNQIGASEDFSLEIVFSSELDDDSLHIKKLDKDENIFIIVSEYKYTFCFDFDELNSNIQKMLMKN
ncbi:MAG: AAA family ATPase [Crocosphaera sp.]